MQRQNTARRTIHLVGHRNSGTVSGSSTAAHSIVPPAPPVAFAVTVTVLPASEVPTTVPSCFPASPHLHLPHHCRCSPHLLLHPWHSPSSSGCHHRYCYRSTPHPPYHPGRPRRHHRWHHPPTGRILRQGQIARGRSGQRIDGIGIASDTTITTAVVPPTGTTSGCAADIHVTTGRGTAHRAQNTRTTGTTCPGYARL